MQVQSNSVDTETKIVNSATAPNQGMESKSEFVSLTDWLTEDDPGDVGHLETIRLNQEPKYLSLFTQSLVMTDAHFLDANETFPDRGYYRCLGDDCPACKAEIEKKKFMLLPVADLEDGQIKILRVPRARGVGKLANELGKVLSLDDPSKVISVVTMDKNYGYTVSTKQSGEFSADIAEAIKRFEKNVSDGVVNINDVIVTISAEEMAVHGRIAKRLKLSGNA